MDLVVVHWEVKGDTAFGDCAICKTSANEVRHEVTDINAGIMEGERAGDNRNETAAMAHRIT